MISKTLPKRRFSGFSDWSLGTVSVTDAGGVADIRSPRRLQTTGSDHEMRRAPAGATQWWARHFRRPYRGLDQLFVTNRWFAPPANFRDALRRPLSCNPQISAKNQAHLSRFLLVQIVSVGFPLKETRSPPQKNMNLQRLGMQSRLPADRRDLTSSPPEAPL